LTRSTRWPGRNPDMIPCKHKFTRYWPGIDPATGLGLKTMMFSFNTCVFWFLGFVGHVPLMMITIPINRGHMMKRHAFI
jgi:hypothetical protein